MFPLDFPMSRLKKAQRDEWVLDPFCGRGTTNYAARLRNLSSIGVDSNPVAAAITEAKLAAVTSSQVIDACRYLLRSAAEPKELPNGDFWALAYHPDTLYDLCRLREALRQNCDSPRRKALRGLLLGALHGPLTKGPPSYLSNQMPRTYGAKPGYAVKFWKSRKLEPRSISILEVVKRRAKHFFASTAATIESAILCADSRSVDFKSLNTKVSWIVTSPPYYGMTTYVPDQWLRLWLLGGSPEVKYAFPSQLQHRSPEAFAQELAQVWNNVAHICVPNARMIIRFGGIHNRHQDPKGILMSSLSKTTAPWRLSVVRSAGHSSQGRRQAKQFGRTLENPKEEYDFFLRLRS